MPQNRLFWLIFFLIPLVFILSACINTAQGDQLPETDVKTIPQTLSVLRLSMSAGDATGNYYSFGAVLARAIDDASTYLVIDVQDGTEAGVNISRLAEGQAQLALAPGDLLSYAYNGEDIWEDKPPLTDVAPLMTLYPEICQLVVGANAELSRVGDLKGKRIAIGEEGTALRASALKILEEGGLTEEDIEAVPLGFNEAAQAMQEKTIDAFFVTAGTPNKGLMDLQANREITILGLEDEEIEALTEKYPFYTPYTLDENDYSFLTEPVNTVAIRVTLLADTSLSEQAAYDIVKAIIENSDAIAVLHAKGMYIGAAEGQQGLPLELHPGALRYFQQLELLTQPQTEDEEPETPEEAVLE